MKINDGDTNVEIKNSKRTSESSSESDQRNQDYVENLLKTLSSSYCILIISIYLVIIINIFAQTPIEEIDHYTGIGSISLVLYLTSISSMFLIYMMVHLSKPPRSHQHRKSHGSAFLRQGAIVFGFGSVILFTMDSAAHTVNFECTGTLRTVTGFSTIIFFVVQVTIENYYFGSY